MIDLFGNLEGVEVYFDDFFRVGRDLEQHNARLAALLGRCVKVNLKLNQEKCKFFVPEIEYIGYIIGHETLKSDPERVAAIAGFKQPADKQDLQRFLGMVNYLAKFCAKLSEKITLCPRLSRLRIHFRGIFLWSFLLSERKPSSLAHGL